MWCEECGSKVSRGGEGAGACGRLHEWGRDVDGTVENVGEFNRELSSSGKRKVAERENWEIG